MTAPKKIMLFWALLLLLSLGLAACVPTPAIMTDEAQIPSSASVEPTQTLSGAASLTQAPTDENVKTEGSKPEENSDEILVAPTLAPTATPGAIYAVVQQAVEVTNLEQTRILGLLIAD